MRDLIGEVGKDAVRYFFSSVSCDTPMDFDIGLAKQKSNKNPVYYIQYAHARIESIYKKIKEERPDGFDIEGFLAGKTGLFRLSGWKVTVKNRSPGYFFYTPIQFLAAAPIMHRI